MCGFQESVTLVRLQGQVKPEDEQAPNQERGQNTQNEGKIFLGKVFSCPGSQLHITHLLGLDMAVGFQGP